jgi:citrate lyase beta subunit
VTRRLPVHTVYGGAHLFTAQTARKLGRLALESLGTNVSSPRELGEWFGWKDGGFAERLHELMIVKLVREPVEDYRIDFEDGYGPRPDADEDRDAERAAGELASGAADGWLPPFTGIRIKPFTDEWRKRSERTLELFLKAFLSKGQKALPDAFVVNLPKVSEPAQPAALAKLLTRLEKKHRLRPRSIGMELMFETPESILDADGAAAPRRLVEAAGGRCVGAHFGPFDYTASLGVTSADQGLGHPACEFARHVLQVSLSGLDIALSDGPTQIMPVGGKEDVRLAWRAHYDAVRRSLASGWYQGWDLHPAQLVPRYAAVYSFFWENLKTASIRLKTFIGVAARARLIGGVFDDAATGQGLLNFFARAVQCGAIGDQELQSAGVTAEDIDSRSFRAIVERRRASALRGAPTGL